MSYSFAATKCIACVACAAIGSLAFAQATFKTNSFTAKVKLNDDRTMVVDETIELAIDPGNTEGITDLVIAERAGPRPSQYQAARKVLISGANSIPITVEPDSKGDLAVTIPSSALAGGSTVQLRINYSVLGAFAERSDGPLGDRSTLTWDVIPQSWPTDIASAVVEAEYPSGIVPVYVGAITSMSGARAEIKKRADSPFTGSTTRLRTEETPVGVAITPSDALTSGSGFRLIVALPADNLKPAPSKLPPSIMPPIQPNTKLTGAKPKSSGKPRQPATPKTQNPMLVFVLPFVPPLLFLLLYYSRFTWVPMRGFPTSAIPEGVSPAEAGYLIDGALTGQHLLGTLAQLADLGMIKLPIGGPMQVSPTAQNGCGNFEKRLLNSLTQNTAPADMHDLKKRLAIRTHDLEPKLVQSLSKQGVLSGGLKRTQLWSAISLLLANALADYYAVTSGSVLGIVVAAAALVISLLLMAFLRPITRKGLQTARKVAGLRAFIRANQEEFYRNHSGTGFRLLVPYAIAFGVLNDERPRAPAPKPEATVQG